MSDEISPKQQVLNFLAHRKMAYVQVFNPENQFLTALFKDLSAFCRADATTFHTDARLSAALEGRREVWLRIQDHLKLSPDELLAKYGGKTDAIS